MQRYRNLIINLIRFIIIFLFVYFLPTRNIFNLLIKVLFNVDNIWFFILGKIPILIILYIIFDFIDTKQLYNIFSLIKELQRKPIHYLFLLIGAVEFIITLTLLICDKCLYMQISSSDWISYINNLFTADITLVVGITALFQYIESREKEAIPKISIKLNINAFPTYKTDFYNKTKTNLVISILLQSDHSINGLSIRSYNGYSNFYSIKDNVQLETLSKDSAVNISLQLLDGYSNITYYDLLVQNEDYETYIIPFRIIHNGQCVDYYQLVQNKARRER